MIFQVLFIVLISSAIHQVALTNDEISSDVVNNNSHVPLRVVTIMENGNFVDHVYPYEEDDEDLDNYDYNSTEYEEYEDDYIYHEEEWTPEFEENVDNNLTRSNSH
ncbi:hypothetical protein PV327_001572 [Microctonus hyperodae]|uniref:Uncharacterized protein n=1 Tax=Microctonus hyperodae TaxID=165561 RepID=A0AA39L3C5_MICHY|nr:hypothetical protein PV327_001572 [Microctonus hyperodae]